jgi:hypothetical protein
MMPEPKRKYTLRGIFVIAISVFPLVPLLDYLGRRASGPPAAFCAAMIVIAVRWRWELSEERWFWGIVIAIVAIHIPLIWFVPWNTGWIPAIIKMPFCLADFFIISVIISFGEKFFTRAEA